MWLVIFAVLAAAPSASLARGPVTACVIENAVVTDIALAPAGMRCDRWPRPSGVLDIQFPQNTTHITGRRSFIVARPGLTGRVDYVMTGTTGFVSFDLVIGSTRMTGRAPITMFSAGD